MMMPMPTLFDAFIAGFMSSREDYNAERGEGAVYNKAPAVREMYRARIQEEFDAWLGEMEGGVYHEDPKTREKYRTRVLGEMSNANEEL
jgi:hypothetical protein